VHTATLVHDDTIDQALTRRGLKTVNAVWDEKVAILVGDFLFAQSAFLAAQLDSVRIMSLLSETVMAMSSGELRQYASSRDLLMDEADYFQRISGKTASLFAMCCAGAAIVSDQSDENVDRLYRFGTNLGIAFQIADDVLDFMGDESRLGKPAGSDLRQGTITLPVILYAQHRMGSDLNLRNLLDGTDISQVVEAVRESEAIELALGRADEYARAAREALQSFPVGQAREALLGLSYHLVRRSR
jgi:geranylgeranyl pyrophosphate synthase